MRSHVVHDPKFMNMRQVYLDAIRELKTPYPAIGLPDWSYFTKITGGLRAREFSILCGSTGSGKTTFLANVSAQLLKQGTKHFVMSVETGHTDFMKRVMSVLHGRDINTGEAVSVDEIARIHMASARYLEADTIEFSIYDNRVPVEQLLHDLRAMHDLRGCKVAMIDNLNFFLEVTRASDTIVEMDRVIHELIIFCKQTDMHVIMVMHPRKTDGGRIESEFDIKGSSTAVQEAHNVFLFNRPRPEDIESGKRDRTDREVKFAKMRRRGPFVGCELIFDGRNTVYSERGYA